MTTDELLAIEQLRQYQKSGTIAFLLWLFFGSLGGHRYYCKKVKTGFLMTLLFLFSWICFFSIIGISIDSVSSNPDPSDVQDLATLGVLCDVSFIVMIIWVIVDAFRLSGWVRRHNIKVINQFKNENK